MKMHFLIPDTDECKSLHSEGAPYTVRRYYIHALTLSLLLNYNILRFVQLRGIAAYTTIPRLRLRIRMLNVDGAITVWKRSE